MPLYLALLKEALTLTLDTILPIIATLLVVAMATATIQAAFQLEDTALSLLPKTIALVAIALFGGLGAFGSFQFLAVKLITHVDLLIHETW